MNNLIKIIEIDTLVLCGGGIKGLLILGALKYLFENNIIKKIKFFYGTSVGGICILCIIIGWTIDELYHLSINIQFEKLIDYNIKSFLKNNSLISKSKFETLIKKLLIYKGFDENITLIELYNKTNLELNLFTFNLKLSKTICLNHINTPDLKVWESLIMTTALPILLSPFNYNNELYIDGFILDNYPINWLKNEHKSKFIGIYIKSSIYDYEYIFNIFGKKEIYLYIKYIFYILNLLISKELISSDNTIILKFDYDIYKTNFCNFILDNNTKKKILNDGYDQTKILLNNILENLFKLQVSSLKQKIQEKSLIIPSL